MILNKKIKLEDIKFYDVEESFGMGGPFLGRVEIKGKRVRNKFFADNDKYLLDQKFISLVEYKGEKFENRTFLNIIKYQRRVKDFRIILINTQSEDIFESKYLAEALFVEEMKNNIIIYYEAFHNEIQYFKRKIEFNEDNFQRINLAQFFE